jgi:hypothetical protein
LSPPSQRWPIGRAADLPKFASVAPRHLVSRTDDEDPLFVGLRGRLKKRRIQDLFRHYATKAALPAERRHVRVLRHSAAVHVLDAGEDLDLACGEMRLIARSRTGPALLRFPFAPNSDRRVKRAKENIMVRFYCDRCNAEVDAR